MYVGDNDSTNYPLTVPAGNTAGEYAADTTWRRGRLADQRLDRDRRGHRGLGVGRRPDAGPVRLAAARRGQAAERLAHDGGRTRAGSWTRAGHAPAARPPASPARSTPCRYTAPSGARVFAGGTNQWGWGLAYEDTPQIEQATYNVLADMTVQPLTPDGISVDPAGGNKSPTAAFSVTPDARATEPGRDVQRLRLHGLRTARSRSTSGTSTATAPTRSTPGRRRPPPRPTRPRATSRSACASPTTAARPTSPRAPSR